MVAIESTKICKKCQETLPLDSFYSGKRVSAWCKNCFKKYRSSESARVAQNKYRNKESVKKHNQARTKIYRNTQKGIYVRLKSSAKHRNIDFTFTEVELAELYIQSKNCFYCHRSLEAINDLNEFIIAYNGKNGFINKAKSILSSNSGGSKNFTIDRLDSSGAYSKSNCVCCCYLCNQSKGWLFGPKIFSEVAINLIDDLTTICVANGYRTET